MKGCRPGVRLRVRGLSQVVLGFGVFCLRMPGIRFNVYLG